MKSGSFKESFMADDFDIRPHRETWSSFVKLANFSVVGIALLLIAMALFLL